MKDRLAKVLKSLAPAKDGKTNEDTVVKPEEFEKDEDSNFHIDLIYAMANCRASSYKLDLMDWI